MKKLSLLTFCIMSFLIGMAQDTIVNAFNQQYVFSNQNDRNIYQPNIPFQPQIRNRYNDPSRRYQQMPEGAQFGNKIIKFTFVASPQITWLSTNSKEVSSNQSRLGFNFGVEGDIFINNERYSLLTGLTISSLGSTLNYKVPFIFSDSPDELPAGTKVEYFLRYIEIPIAIKMRSKDFNRARFFAQFGLNNWLNVKAKASTSDNSFDKDIVNDEVRFFAFGLNIGGGVEYDLGNDNSVTGGIVYTGSFNDVTHNASVDDKATVNSLRFRLGFIF